MRLLNRITEPTQGQGCDWKESNVHRGPRLQLLLSLLLWAQRLRPSRWPSQPHLLVSAGRGRGRGGDGEGPALDGQLTDLKGTVLR